MSDFRLFETMRVSESGEVALLERHLERLWNSAKYFSFKCDLTELRKRIPHNPGRLRVTLSADGAFEIEPGPLPADNPRLLKLATVRVESSDPFLYHKTTNRKIYEEAARGCDRQTDVLLVNERNEITETTIANVAVFREGRWITPPISCGLLPGVMRAELLARGEIVERAIAVNDLIPGETIRCFNALRGVMEMCAPR
jgi:para-aminobenzoate synthetase / 4-amino-4-deoxychorismate lyase